jgi:hypothetical protein
MVQETNPLDTKDFCDTLHAKEKILYKIKNWMTKAMFSTETVESPKCKTVHNLQPNLLSKI